MRTVRTGRRPECLALYGDPLMRRFFRTFRRELFRAFAPFRTVDDYGTDARAYSFQAAAEWLPYCSRFALVQSRITGRVLARRIGPNIAQA